MSGLNSNLLWFNNTELCSTFNAVMVHRQVLNAPSRTVTKVNIPGRNGVKYIDEGILGNVTQSYTLIFQTDFWQNYNKLKSFLLSVKDYARLRDYLETEHSTNAYYMMARVSGITPKADRWLDSGYVVITFDRLPQRWLLSGDSFNNVSSGDYFPNLTNFSALPIIRVVGTGTIVISPVNSISVDSAKYALTVLEHPTTGQGAIPYIDIDSELQDCYYGDINCNQYVRITKGYFPELEPGDNYIVFTSESMSLSVAARWWTV